ncbi:unnamed protein product [Merluccius merluccius]
MWRLGLWRLKLGRLGLCSLELLVGRQPHINMNTEGGRTSAHKQSCRSRSDTGRTSAAHRPPPLHPPLPSHGQMFRYKTRVYKQTNLDEKQLAKLHTKASLKKFMDYIQTSSVDKMVKFLEKGLDPNYQDADTGGERLT